MMLLEKKKWLKVIVQDFLKNPCGPKKPIEKKIQVVKTDCSNFINEFCFVGIVFCRSMRREYT